MATLTVSYTTDITPAGGFRLFYRPKGSSLPYTQHGVNFFASPATVAGVVDQDYEGYLEGDAGDGSFCPQLNFSTTKYSCVDIDDFDLDSSVADEIKLLFPIVFGVVPHVNQVITVTCKDLVTDTGIGTTVIVVAPDGTLVSPAGDIKFVGLVTGRNYRITLTNNCDSDFATSQDIVAGAGLLKQWVENTAVCEQDAVFTLDSQVTGFSSPAALYYDEASGRIYIGDQDDVAGNVYWINPNTFAAIGDINRVAFVNGTYYTVKVDKQYKRIYFVGENSGGLRVFNIADHTNQLVPYGVDGVPFNRISVNIFDTSIVTIDRSAGTLTIIDRATLTVVTTKSISSIPNGNTYLVDCYITQVGGEYWVSSENRIASPVAVYDLNFTTNTDVIALPGVLPETGGRYRQGCYYDAANDKFYVSDSGSSKWFVLDGATKTIISQTTITNRQGKSFAIAGWIDDPITNDLFMLVGAYNGPGDPTPLNRTYLQDRGTYALSKVYPDNSFNSLAHQVGTNKVWGVVAGQPQWGLAGWDTDGKIIKYSH